MATWSRESSFFSFRPPSLEGIQKMKRAAGTAGFQGTGQRGCGLVVVWVGNQRVWVGNYESATKKGLSRQPKRVWVDNQKRWFGNFESATKKALSRQPKKRHVGNQKPNSSKIEAVASFEGSSLWVGN